MLVKTLKKTVATLFMPFGAPVSVSCGGSPHSAIESSNAVYYWRTTFKLDPAERSPARRLPKIIFIVLSAIQRTITDIQLHHLKLRNNLLK